MDEFEIIKNYFRPLTNPEKSQNLQDDVALLDHDLIVSKDIIVENVHFYSCDSPNNIANRLLRSNLSDIAASGAKPTHYLLGFSKNNKTDEKFINEFCRSLKEINDEFGISLIGGDTVNANNDLFFSVTIFGKSNGKILSRDKAEEDELIYVSGTIGDAYLARIDKKNEYFANRFYKPSPRIKLGEELVKQNLSNCAIDISDGLLADLRHICQASNLNSEIFQENIPLSSEAQSYLKKHKNVSILDLISGGDDYELIFTAKKTNKKEIQELSNKLGIALTNIGVLTRKVENDNIVKYFHKNNEITITKFGYEH